MVKTAVYGQGRGGHLTKRDEIANNYLDIHKRIHEAQNILIIGGGPLGVELAAEIRSAYSSKEITICHTGVSLAYNTRLQDIRA